MNHVRIKSDGTPFGTKVFVDGVELTNVVSFEVRAIGQQLHTVDVRMYIDELEIDGPAKVEIVASPLA